MRTSADEKRAGCGLALRVFRDDWADVYGEEDPAPGAAGAEGCASSALSEQAGRAGMPREEDPAPGAAKDVGPADLSRVWLLMRAEGLVEKVFHDGGVGNFAQFYQYARAGWFFIVMDGPAYLGWGMVNGFTNSGNTALVHFCSFEYGRRSGKFYEACMLFHETIAGHGKIATLVAMLPHCYRAARAMIERQGFEFKMRLPGALKLCRNGKERAADSCVYVKSYNKIEDIHKGE